MPYELKLTATELRLLGLALDLYDHKGSSDAERDCIMRLQAMIKDMKKIRMEKTL